MFLQVEHPKLVNTFEFDPCVCQFLVGKQEQLFISADINIDEEIRWWCWGLRNIKTGN